MYARRYRYAKKLNLPHVSDTECDDETMDRWFKLQRKRLHFLMRYLSESAAPAAATAADDRTSEGSNQIWGWWR